MAYIYFREKTLKDFDAMSAIIDAGYVLKNRTKPIGTHTIRFDIEGPGVPKYGDPQITLELNGYDDNIEVVDVHKKCSSLIKR